MRIRQRHFTFAVAGLLQLACMLGTTAQDRAPRATISDEPLSDRLVAYTIEAALDPNTRTIHGVERLRWRNPDSVPVSELQFHLYLNAFRDVNSTFMKESGGQHRGFSASGDDPWGGVDIERMERVVPEGAETLDAPAGGRVDLTDDIRFIQPDDGNVDDLTVISVHLDAPVQPGAWIELEIAFESRLPQIVARTGWERTEDGDLFVMVAQWFPKIAVLEIPGQRYVPADAARGEWNAHQFHANSEFYADFGTYDVTIDVPAEYVVGATGVLVDESSRTNDANPGDASGREIDDEDMGAGGGGNDVANGDDDSDDSDAANGGGDPATGRSGRRGGVSTDGLTGARKVVRYLAEDVHDFAWTASPELLEYTDKWRHVDIRLLLRPEHRGQVRRHFDAAKVALEHFDEWVGPYPYTTLTLVDGYGGSNGMEYPTLITCGTYYGLPGWLRFLELVTIHEFGHQYFYGMLASNEFEEAWLDEGINSFLETRIMDDAYGRGAAINFPGLPLDNTEMQRLSYTENRPESGALFTNSWEYAKGDYGKASYAKPATVMNSLQGYLGFDRMTELLRAYYERWSFRHPTTRDVQDVAEATSGEDLHWFFDQFVYGTAVVDYEVTSIDVARPDSGNGNVNSVVTVSRLFDGYFPVDVRVTFEDDVIETIAWDGRAEERVLTFERPAAVREVYIDPEHRVALDVNLINNRRTTQPSNPFAAKVLVKAAAWTQQLVYLLGGIL